MLKQYFKHNILNATSLLPPLSLWLNSVEHTSASDPTVPIKVLRTKMGARVSFLPFPLLLHQPFSEFEQFCLLRGSLLISAFHFPSLCRFLPCSSIHIAPSCPEDNKLLYGFPFSSLCCPCFPEQPADSGVVAFHL